MIYLGGIPVEGIKPFSFEPKEAVVRSFKVPGLDLFEVGKTTDFYFIVPKQHCATNTLLFHLPFSLVYRIPFLDKLIRHDTIHRKGTLTGITPVFDEAGEMTVHTLEFLASRPDPSDMSEGYL